MRAGRGEGVDPNMSHPAFPRLRDTLRAMGLGVWGWHVPFCKDAAAASLHELRQDVAALRNWIMGAVLASCLGLIGVVVQLLRRP